MAEDPNQEASEGRAVALATLVEIAARNTRTRALANPTLERVVDIAWRHQFIVSDRRIARAELREALRPEIARRLADES